MPIVRKKKSRSQRKVNNVTEAHDSVVGFCCTGSMSKENTTKNHIATSSNSLNKLRAAVLGANDGIVSTAGLVLGVTGAAASRETIILAGAAGLIAGALSMAAGEFVSVSSQRDSEQAFLVHRKQHIKAASDSSADELVEIYVKKGLSNQTAILAVQELSEKNLVDYEIEKESGIDAKDISSPWGAATSSAIAFVIGAIIPLAAIVFSPKNLILPITICSVILSLILTGTLSSRAGQANQLRAALRVVAWGVSAMILTYFIGFVLGVSAL